MRKGKAKRGILASWCVYYLCVGQKADEMPATVARMTVQAVGGSAKRYMHRGKASEHAVLTGLLQCTMWFALGAVFHGADPHSSLSNAF